MNNEFSIISSDCTGGCICKDLKVQMKSPTRNFYFNSNDYIKFCKNLKYYLSLSLSRDKDNNNHELSSYLTAMCGDVRLFLVHYESYEQAAEEWERRKGRVNFGNLFFIMNDRNNCTEEDLDEFEKLPYKNKICFTHIPYPDRKYTYYLPGSEKKTCVESVMKYIHPWWVKRYYDIFDYVEFLNNGNIDC